MMDREQVQRKAAYHHGDLRETLVKAALQLVNEEGWERFSLAKCCRRAGVSTAAPYRHFRDRDEILAAIVGHGFEMLENNLLAAMEGTCTDTCEGIIAMGIAYVEFAQSEPRLFRLMFGQHPNLKKEEIVQRTSDGCFGRLIDEVTRHCRANGISGEPGLIATQLWTFVHGASSLAIDGAYAIKAPDLDIKAMISEATHRLLAHASP